MESTLLPKIVKVKALDISHFPNKFYLAVFRFWETVPAERIALALESTPEIVKKAAEDMGLPNQKYDTRWEDCGYITTIRNAWHILPYEQLLLLLGWSEEKLSAILKEDDFLFVKLGNFKPYCEKVLWEALDRKGEKKLFLIRKVINEHFKDFFCGESPFDFFNASEKNEIYSSDGIRMVYSYCGLYASVLDNEIEKSYPEILLQSYSSVGINAIWLPVVLYQMLPFPFDESLSKGWEKRQERLRELISLAGKYGIKVYLYLNEPRCMPIDFFENNPSLKGKEVGAYASLCTSASGVMDYLRYAVRELCNAAPGLGGFFVITCSENLTHCKSSKNGTICPHCEQRPIYNIISEVLNTISEESRKIDSEIKTIAWTWAWEDFMNDEEIKKCIDLLCPEIIIQCNSEAKKEFKIGNVCGEVADYSMSVIGPGEMAKNIWNYAREKGHDISAKIQVNNTWECSTVPFIPVFDLIREHISALKKTGTKHLMLSWTLGGYPSLNLKIAAACLDDESEAKYDLLLCDEFGADWKNVKKAASIFSEAFKEFPFCINSLYYGPQNAGPSNPLHMEKCDFSATMTCYSYDDLDKWRGIYPRKTYIKQLKKLSEKWKKGIDEIENMYDCPFKMTALACYSIFYSSYLQALFIDNRDNGQTEVLMDIVKEEKRMALLMYSLMQKSSLLGYEAANHYYFNRGMLAEKVINCEHFESILTHQ